MTGFIGGAGGSQIIAADDDRLQAKWWELERPARAENFRTRHWPRPGGLDGGILEGVWYDGDDAASPGGAQGARIPGTVYPAGTIYIPQGKLAHVTIEGLSASETHVDLQSQHFKSADEGIFTVVPGGPTAPNEADLYAGAIGESTLFVRADGDPGPGRIGVALDQPIVVYRIATQTRMRLQIANGQEVPVYEEIPIPLGQTAKVRIFGLDDAGKEAPMTAQSWQITLGTAFTIAATADPNIVFLTPVELGVATLEASADGDIGPGVVPLSFTNDFAIVPGVATHFGVEYDVEDI